MWRRDRSTCREETGQRSRCAIIDFVHILGNVNTTALRRVVAAVLVARWTIVPATTATALVLRGGVGGGGWRTVSRHLMQGVRVGVV